MPRGFSDYDTARIQGRLWSPAVLRLGLWLDCSDLSSMTLTGNVISTLRDKSGNGRNATSVNSPTLVLEAKNGLSIGRVTSATSDCWSIDLDWLAGAGQNHTAIAAFKYDEARDCKLYGARDGGFGAGSLHAGFRRGSFGGKMVLNYWANDTETTGRPALLDVSIGNVCSFIWNTSAIRVIRARGAATDATGPASSQIAAMAGGGRIFRVAETNYQDPNADLYELLIAPSSLPLHQVAAAEGYLAWKWNLPLAADHPYANRPPLIGD